MTAQEKDDCLKEVTAWSGLTVFIFHAPPPPFFGGNFYLSTSSSVRGRTFDART